MSLKEVDLALLDLQIDDEIIQTPGNCRYAASKMKETATMADKTPPHTDIQIVVWRPLNVLDPETNVHFALSVRGEHTRFIFNPSPTALFPRYNGPLNSAPGLFNEMRPTEELGKKEVHK